MTMILLNDGPLCGKMLEAESFMPDLHMPFLNRGPGPTIGFVVYRKTDMATSDGTIIFEWVPGEGKGELR